MNKLSNVLTAHGRDMIKEKNFALPGERYPIHDRVHARAALSMVAKHGTPEEQATVRRKVHNKYPGIGSMDKKAFLEETYNSAFNDELEKISGKKKSLTYGAAGAAVGGAGGLATGIVNRQYLKKNPLSKMTNPRIVKMMKGLSRKKLMNPTLKGGIAAAAIGALLGALSEEKK